MFLYALYINNFTEEGIDYDDCAICRAWSKKGAIKKFSKMYGGCDLNDFVDRVKFNKLGIYVLSDY